MTSDSQIRRYLSIETAGENTCHPDGKRIAFVSNSFGHYQLSTCEVSRGVTYDRKQLTNVRDRCTDPQYLSAGSLIFSRDRTGDENFQIGLIDEDDELYWLAEALVAKHRIGYISESYVYFSVNIIDKARLEVYRWK